MFFQVHCDLLIQEKVNATKT